MNHRMWLIFPAIMVMSTCGSALAQIVPDVPPTSPRNELPFAREPDRLPGPPRAMGELPEGASQPPSTLPGRVFGQPPRAMGEAPNTPGAAPTSPFAPGFQGGTTGGTTTLPPLGSPGGTTSSPAGSFFVPGLLGSPMGANPGRSGPGDLPPALPDLGTMPPASGAGAARRRPSGPPLLLEEMLASLERTYPPFQAILQERDIAAGDVLSAEGAFDLHLNADSRNYPLGYYNRSVHDVFLEQPLRWNGAKVFGGYRLAQGRFPDYYNYLNTRGGGALVAGIDLPLLRNREIDARRAKLMQAEIERCKVEPTIVKQRITLFKDASKVYWNWVAAGQSSAIYRDLIRVSEARGEGLERQVREGIGRAIDLVDFRRILLSRQQQSVAADRRFQQATIELSLYYRDGQGFPSMPEEARLPQDFPPAPPPDPRRLPEDIEVALRLRPEILSLRLQARKADVDRQFARNQLKPSLNLYVYTEQNVGNRDADLGKDFRPFIMESSLLFDIPLQRSHARGRVMAADANLRQVAMQTRYASERIRADVQDATSALVTAHEQLVRYRENELVNRRLEQAERTALREGSSTVLFLNLREQSTSDARAARVEAEAKFHAALAEYRAALGVDAAPTGQ